MCRCCNLFISPYNSITFRLLANRYNLSQSSSSPIFLVYFFGSLSSSLMGMLLQRFGPRFMIRLAIGSMLLRTLLMLAGSLLHP